jgi:uncharacterized protein (DUF169 family)
MSETSTYVDPAYSTRVYYILSDTFKRPIEFKLFTNYNSEAKARESFHSAFYPCKVVEFVTLREGMIYMAASETFDESGEVVRGQ